MANGVLKYRKYQDQRKGVPSSGKWYGRAVQDRTVEFADFVTHMANHNSPYSRGVINGVLMDMLSCLQELVLDGKAVRLGELGLIFAGHAHQAGRYGSRLYDGQHPGGASERAQHEDLEQCRAAQAVPPGRADGLQQGDGLYRRPGFWPGGRRWRYVGVIFSPTPPLAAKNVTVATEGTEKGSLKAIK